MLLRKEKGFTAMELMIVLGIFGLIVAASWGNFQSLIRQQRLIGATNQLPSVSGTTPSPAMQGGAAKKTSAWSPNIENTHATGLRSAL